MKHIVYSEGKGPEGLSFAQAEDLEPGPEELLVAVKATALNRADLLQRRGQYPPPPGASSILGLEMAGVVTRTGENVTGWGPGDRVCALLPGGGYASQAVLHQDMALALPPNLSFEEAAAVPEAFLTAFQCLRFLADLQPSERLLLHAGASGVGTAAIQLARRMEADVYVTASAPKHALCLDLGATHAIDYRSADFVEALKERTDGEGVDVIVDPVGAPYFKKNLRLLRPDGRLVCLAFMGGTQVPEVDLSILLRKRLQVIGTTLRNRSLAYKVRLTRSFAAFAWSAFETGECRPVIDRVVPWTQVADAHRRMEANANAGKIVMRVEA